MKPPGGDWTALIVLAIVSAVALTGLGFLGGYAVGYAQSRPSGATTTARATAALPEAKPTPTLPSSPLSTPTPTPSLTWTPTLNPTAADGSPQCSFADFPFYPGSDNYHTSPPMRNAWYINQPTSQVASYFARGAYQRTWAFVAGPSATVAPGSSVMSYKFRFTRAPACRGELRIFPESLQGASVYQAIPDAP